MAEGERSMTSQADPGRSLDLCGPPAGRVHVRGLTGADADLLECLRSAPHAVRALRLAEAVAEPVHGTLPLGIVTASDLNRILLACLAETLGVTVRLLAPCSTCEASAQLPLDLEEVLAEEPGRQGGGDLVWQGWHIRLTPPSAAALADAGRRARTDRAGALDALRASCIDVLEAPEDAAQTPLPRGLLAAADAALAETDAAGLCCITVRCPACGTAAVHRLDGLALLERELAAGSALWDDVARIAASYRWSAPEVLALPHRHRRQLARRLLDGSRRQELRAETATQR